MAKANPYITATLVFFVVLFGLLLLQQSSEGFQGSKTLETRYKAILAAFAKLKQFKTLQQDIRQTLLEGIRESKTPEDPEETLFQIYEKEIGDEPLDVAMFELPLWSNDTEDLSLALSAIPDDFHDAIKKELAFYKKKIDELNQIFSNLSDPSTFKIPETKEEGFEDGKCTAEASRLAREQLRKKRKEKSKVRQRRKATAADCIIKPLPEELTRIEKILEKIDIDALAAEIRKVSEGITKFRRDFQKLKDGTLYDWQKSGPKKSYPTFKGKSNADGLLFSLQQSAS